MLDSFLVQVRVSGGLPDHTHVSVTSEPMSVTVGLGSTTIRGATGGGKRVTWQCRGGSSSVGVRGDAAAAPLTVHVHQRADVGAADVVVHLAGDGLREEGVIHLRVVPVLLGVLDDHPPLGPPGGGQNPEVGAFRAPPPRDPHMMLKPSQEVGGRPSPVAFDLGVGSCHAGEHDPLALLHRLGLDGQSDGRGICGGADGAVTVSRLRCGGGDTRGVSPIAPSPHSTRDTPKAAARCRNIPARGECPVSLPGMGTQDPCQVWVLTMGTQHPIPVWVPAWAPHISY